MCLHIDSDAAYLVQPKARSRVGGHFFLSDNPPPAPAKPTPKPNGPIHTECSTIRAVMSSAAEAETGAIFINGQKAIPMRTALQEMNHPQPPTTMKTDSATSHGILTGNMRRKKSKAFDMRFHWMKDRILQAQFHLYWMRGKDNQADYFTKHFPPLYHCLMRYKYLHWNRDQLNSAQSPVQGCVHTTAYTDRLAVPRTIQADHHSRLTSHVAVTLNGLCHSNNGHPMNIIHQYSS